ncbi:MAG: hypothetical protein ACXVR1_00755, partial [Solirubrobacteraceae bacterium]
LRGQAWCTLPPTRWVVGLRLKVALGVAARAVPALIATAHANATETAVAIIDSAGERRRSRRGVASGL